MTLGFEFEDNMRTYSHSVTINTQAYTMTIVSSPLTRESSLYNTAVPLAISCWIQQYIKMNLSGRTSARYRHLKYASGLIITMPFDLIKYRYVTEAKTVVPGIIWLIEIFHDEHIYPFTFQGIRWFQRAIKRTTAIADFMCWVYDLFHKCREGFIHAAYLMNCPMRKFRPFVHIVCSRRCSTGPLNATTELWKIKFRARELYGTLEPSNSVGYLPRYIASMLWMGRPL